MNMKNTAVLVLDMQNEMVDPKGKIGASGFAKIVEDGRLIPNIAEVVKAARAKDYPVVFVRVGFRPDYLDVLSRAPRVARLKQSGAVQIGSWGLEFPDALAPLPGEMVYTKQAVNPFFNTGLMSWLLRNGIDSVALCGVFTHMVVDSAARYADDCGFQVTVLKDCCASPDPELHRIEVEKILPHFGRVVTSAEFIATL
jgi:nicotinamidase-related amidase